MPRPYLVGWYYALKDLKRRIKIKPHRRIWLQMVKKKYYWLTPEERVEANERMFKALKNISMKPPIGDFNGEYY